MNDFDHVLLSNNLLSRFPTFRVSKLQVSYELKLLRLCAKLNLFKDGELCVPVIYDYVLHVAHNSLRLIGRRLVHLDRAAHAIVLGSHQVLFDVVDFRFQLHVL